MKKLLSIITVLVIGVIAFAQPNPQHKKVRDKFFPDTNYVINTPAFRAGEGFLDNKYYTQYDPLISYLEELQNQHSDVMKLTYIGETQKGRKIPQVEIKRGSGEKVRMWIQGGIHGNEPASTEAVLFFMHELLNNPEKSHLLDRVEFRILPMANPDGFNIQNRYAANGLDLNRDQTKFVIPESMILKSAFTTFDADVALDMHEFRAFRRDFTKINEWGVTSAFDVMFLYSGNLNVPEDLRNFTKEEFVDPTKAQIEALGYKHHDYFSTVKHFGELQFNEGSVNARSSATSYALSNCISTLIEVRGVALKDDSFKRRVLTGYTVISNYAQMSYDKKDEIKALLKKTGAQQAELAHIDMKRKQESDSVLFIDIATNEYQYIPAVVNRAWYATSEYNRKSPYAYIILPGNDNVVERLKVLGVQVEQVNEASSLAVETYMISEYWQEKEKYEGVNKQHVKVVTQQSTKDIPEGSYIVYTNQPNIGFAYETLEPEGQNSFVTFDILHTGLNQELPVYRLLNNPNL